MGWIFLISYWKLWKMNWSEVWISWYGFWNWLVEMWSYCFCLICCLIILIWCKVGSIWARGWKLMYVVWWWVFVIVVVVIYGWILISVFLIRFFLFLFVKKICLIFFLICRLCWLIKKFVFGERWKILVVCLWWIFIWRKLYRLGCWGSKLFN